MMQQTDKTAAASLGGAGGSQQPQQFNLALDDKVLRMLLDIQPWPSTMAELHSRCATAEADIGDKQAKQFDYLVKKVFPTLIPAMNDLTEVVRRDVDARSGHPAAPPTFQATRCSPAVGEGQYPATGVVHPIVWLAQRLMRGGPDRGVGSDADHPLCELMRRAPPQVAPKQQ